MIIGGASFFGGRGTVEGAIVGVLIFGVINNGLNLLNVTTYLQLVAIGVIVVVRGRARRRQTPAGRALRTARGRRNERRARGRGLRKQYGATTALRDVTSRYENEVLR